MMLRHLVLLSLCVSIAFCVTCYVGQQTLPNKGDVFSSTLVQSAMSIRDCGPQVRMCFKSYVRRDHDGDNSHTETRDCGDPNSGRCFQDTGCSGPGSNKICCCSGDLCNSAPNSVSLSLTLIATILVARFVCL